MRSFRMAAFVLAIVIGLASEAASQSNPTKAADHTAAVTLDRYGDPLPEGAIARFGTVRLRHTSLLNGVAFSPNGETLATCGFDRPVRLWEASTGKPIRELTGTVDRGTFGVSFSPDGTKLAYAVHPPTQPANLGLPGLPMTDVNVPGNVPYTAPYPTLIEYSGYGYANPAGPDSGIAVLANLMGFAVVDVNMRGTGCSGGAFDFFEPLQSLDGYDIIETVARQKWVRGGKVGMLGISYGFFKLQDKITKGGISVPEDEEMMGLDKAEMGALAYPDFELKSPAPDDSADRSPSPI